MIDLGVKNVTIDYEPADESDFGSSNSEIDIEDFPNDL